jgi:hypothetical protein
MVSSLNPRMMTLENLVIPTWLVQNLHAWTSGIQSDIPHYVGNFNITSTIFRNVEFCTLKGFSSNNKKIVKKDKYESSRIFSSSKLKFPN